MKAYSEYFTNNHIIDIIQSKKQYDKHKFELENIKRSQSMSSNYRLLQSPESKFQNLHDSMREVFSQSRQYNVRQKEQNILQDNQKILQKLKEIQKGEQDSIAKQFMDMQPRRNKKKRRNKSRRLKEEIESISALLEQEDKMQMNNYNDLINAVNIDQDIQITQTDLYNNSNHNNNNKNNYHNIYINSNQNSNHQSTSTRANSHLQNLRKSLNIEFRKEEQRKIAQNNIQLINKITQVQANINHKDLEKDFRQSQKYKKNVRKQSKTRQNFVNNFLISTFSRPSSCGHNILSDKLMTTKNNSRNDSSQKPNSQNKNNNMNENKIQENNQISHQITSSSFNIQNTTPNQQQLDLFTISTEKDEVCLPNVDKFQMMSQTKQIFHNKQLQNIPISIQTQQNETEIIKQSTLNTNESKQNLNENQNKQKQRSYSLRSQSQTVAVSPFIVKKKNLNINHQNNKQIANLHKDESPAQIKQIYQKYKQQTWSRNNNLFQIQPPKSVKMIQNTTPTPMKRAITEYENSPHFRSKRILSPTSYKFRSHNLNIKRPSLPQKDQYYSQKTNHTLTDHSILMQKSLSLIESDYEEKQESLNEMEFHKIKLQKRMKQLSIQNNIETNNSNNNKNDNNEDDYNEKLNIKIEPESVVIKKQQISSPMTTKKINTINSPQKMQGNKANRRNTRDNYNNKENYNKEYLSKLINDLNELQQSKIEISSKTKNVNLLDQDQITNENQESLLSLNDVNPKSPNQIQNQTQNVTSSKHAWNSITDKEKYLLINSQSNKKQYFFSKYITNSSSSRTAMSPFTEPVNSTIYNQQNIQNYSNKKNQNQKIQQQLSNTFHLPSSNNSNNHKKNLLPPSYPAIRLKSTSETR